MAANCTAAIEAGGTKFICALFDNKRELIKKKRVETTTPEKTLAAVINFFNEQKSQGYHFEHLGLASFGPLDLMANSPNYGSITKTPKAYWSDTPLLKTLESKLNAKVHIDTDVNAAALAEYKWGAGQNANVAVYVTIGTGFGGGLVINGHTVKGLVHPEMGHMRVKVPEGVSGHCPFHADCVEGLASGTSMQKIWQMSTQDMAEDHPAWELQANIVGQFCHNLLMTLSAEKIILGGGVMQQSFLLDKIIEQTEQQLGAYLSLPEGMPLTDIIVTPGLGTESGLLGALALVENALN